MSYHTPTPAEAIRLRGEQYLEGLITREELQHGIMWAASQVKTDEEMLASAKLITTEAA